MLLAKQPDYFEEAEKEIRARFKTKE
jgi:hypothetical protein